MTWGSGLIAEAACHGTVTIDDESMNREAWAFLNNYVLWQGADQAGEDWTVPGRHGALANPRWRQPATRSMELLIIGDVDPDGDPNDDRIVGLEENVAWLQEWVEHTVASLEGTRTLVLTLPSGATRTGEVHVGPMQLGSVISGAFTATLEVQIPDGQLGDPVPASS